MSSTLSARYYLSAFPETGFVAQLMFLSYVKSKINW